MSSAVKYAIDGLIEFHSEKIIEKSKNGITVSQASEFTKLSKYHIYRLISEMVNRKMLFVTTARTINRTFFYFDTIEKAKKKDIQILKERREKDKVSKAMARERLALREEQKTKIDSNSLDWSGLRIWGNFSPTNTSV